MTAIIGYTNRLQESTATITASTEASGYEKENAYDGNLWDWWKGTAAGTHTLIVDLGSSKAADYFGCAGHTIADNSGNIRLFYSDTGTSGPWTGCFTAITPTDSSVIFKSFSSLTKRYWKIEIVDSGSPSQIGYVSFGPRLDLPYDMMPGFVPPLYHYDNIMTAQQTQAGAHLISSVKQRGISFDIKMPDLLTSSFVRGDYVTFLEHAYLGKLFFFQFDNDNHPSESVIAKAENIVPISYSSHIHLTHSISCQGFKHY